VSFLIFLLIFLVLFAIGLPVAFAMIGSSVLYAISNNLNLSFLNVEMYLSLNNFVLIAIPMFILTAEIMNASTIADRLFKFSNSLVGFIPGGLGHVNVVSSTIFGGMSGSSAADAGGIGYLAYKAMADKGFGKPFSAAVTASSSIIGSIIPPSIPMIVYAMVANVSVGGLFLAGVIPGILMALAQMVAVAYISIKRGYPIEARPTIAIAISTFLSSFLAILTPMILLGTISLGIVTISEAAVISVLYCLLIGVFIYKTVDVKNFLQSIKNVFITCGIILILFPAGKIFGHVLTVEKIPDKFASFFLDVSDNKIVLLLMINVMFLILGCFSEALINIMLFVPVVLPLIEVLGLDPIHFGVMIIFNAMIGTITPPLGGLVFITSGVTRVPVDSIFKEIVPFVVLSLVVLLLITFIPQLVLFIPNLF
jgi:tripartite ATP-independent transporter DctM subunit